MLRPGLLFSTDKSKIFPGWKKENLPQDSGFMTMGILWGGSAFRQIKEFGVGGGESILEYLEFTRVLMPQ